MDKIKNFYQSDNTVLNDAFDKLAAEIYIKKQKDGYKSFAICGTEPGVGSTTIAISVAVSMAKAGWNVLLIDCDLRKNPDEKRLTESNPLGIAELITDGKAVTDIICKTNYDKLSFIASGNKQVNAVSAVCSVQMKDLMAKVKDEYDYVIVDMPSIASSVDGAVMATIVDTVILVASQEKGYHIKAIKTAKQKLDEVGANITGVVLNHVEASEYKHAVKDYDYFKKHKYITTKTNKK